MGGRRYAGRDQGDTVLISGAGVAGPALAYWLGRYGYRPTVVEVTQGLRGGGFAVDFRGAVHREVLARMGLLDELRGCGTGGSPMAFIDAEGAEVARMPPEFAGGEIELLRSDLSRILYTHSRPVPRAEEERREGGAAEDGAPGGRPATEYVFGDTITALRETGEGVHVTFARHAPRTFSLVVGADGLRSTVRRLAFGPDSRFVRHLGYSVAGWDLPPGSAPGLADRAVGYGEPGRLASVGRTPRRNGEEGYAGEAFCVFAAEETAYDSSDRDAQKRLLARAYAGAGWRTSELIDTVWAAEELYFDSLSRVDVPRWSTRRIALLGDAAYGATLGGMGTGSALVGAYVLAGELVAAAGDPARAFTAYENRLRPYVTQCQQGGRAAGEFLAPPTREAMAARDALLRDPEALAAMLAQGTDISADLVLPDYPDAGPAVR